MKIVIAPDSFKESMSAVEAARAMKQGVLEVFPKATCVLVPMSDGGEGFAKLVSSAWGAAWVRVDSVDALGRQIYSSYGLVGDQAVIDMSSAVGLDLIRPGDRDVVRSSSAGLGLLILDAVKKGARRIVIGVGGSATNDAGAGMLVALGAKLLHEDGRECRGALADLSAVVSLDMRGIPQALKDSQIIIACDVSNPLTGSRGASAVFGAQKGMRSCEVGQYDAILTRFATMAGMDNVAKVAGTGAGGGVAFALLAFLGAELRVGVDLFSEFLGLANLVENADLVLTGEGSVDSQTLEGKTPAGVARVSAEAGVPVVLFAGKVLPGAERLLEQGVTEIIQIAQDGTPLEQALVQGPTNLYAATKVVLQQIRSRT